MALADVYGEIRAAAREQAAFETDRAALEARLVSMFLDRLNETGLVESAATTWLTKTVHDIVADIVKPAGASPRAPSGQMVAWPGMRPVAGWHALRVYARQQRGVYLRYQLCVRIIAALDVAFGDDATGLEQFETLTDACVAAGVDPRDIEALAA
jgi:hypothetical protein